MPRHSNYRRGDTRPNADGTTTTTEPRLLFSGIGASLDGTTHAAALAEARAVDAPDPFTTEPPRPIENP